jgi:hypothetical protein
MQAMSASQRFAAVVLHEEQSTDASDGRYNRHLIVPNRQRNTLLSQLSRPLTPPAAVVLPRAPGTIIGGQFDSGNQAP